MLLGASEIRRLAMRRSFCSPFGAMRDCSGQARHRANAKESVSQPMRHANSAVPIALLQRLSPALLAGREHVKGAGSARRDRIAMRCVGQRVIALSRSKALDLE